jgi:proteic killer suppression protein
MIRSFRHTGLRRFFAADDPRGIRSDLVERCRSRLQALQEAESLDDLRIHGANLHLLHGLPKRYSMNVNGPWRITFEWKDGDAVRVDLEQYH